MPNPYLLINIESVVFPWKLKTAHTEHEYVIRSTDNKFLLRLKKRESYPINFCHPTEDGGFLLGYGDITKQPENEYLLIKITPEGLVIERDVFGTLPLFYSQTPQGCIISNHYGQVVKGSPAHQLDARAIIDVLACQDRQLGTTLLNDVKALIEREVLHYDRRGLAIDYPPPRAWGLSAAAVPTDPKQFPRRFEDALQSFYVTRLQGQSFAFEVSGGLDSSTLPQYISRHVTGRQRMAAVTLPAEVTDTQMPKINALARQTGYELVEISLNQQHDYPLARVLEDPDYEAFFYGEEVFYASWLLKHARQLQSRQVTVLATGMGGDDIFENIVSIEDEILMGSQGEYPHGLTQLPPFVTDQFIQLHTHFMTLPDIHPLPLLPHSTVKSGFMNNIYIDYNIWPISPFKNPDLYRFCQGLPAYMRANKNILRAYHQASGFAPEIYVPMKGENMRPLFETFYLSERFWERVQDILPHSITIAANYIDAGKLTATIRQASHDPSYLAWSFAVREWLCTELSLQKSGRILQA
jgi:hypothetical protein